MKILICGFSGAGKSTWLQELSKKRGKWSSFEFFDQDELIANALAIMPNELGQWILKNGEFKFREIEFQILAEILDSDKNIVLSLGGGALNAEILNRIAENKNEIKLVFLNEKIEVCLERIKNDSNRLLSTKSELELKKLYFQRLELYLSADLIVNPSEIKEIDGLDRLVHTLSTN
jgi:shikimate kinase